MSDLTPIPTSRTYVHSRCGGGTVVSGFEFGTLANPFSLCSGTMCATCGKVFPLKEFAWDDTGETIADYRKRLVSDAPAVQKLLGGPIASIVCGVIGAGVGILFRPGNWEVVPGNWACGVGGFVGGVFLHITVIAPSLIRFLLKVDHRTFK